jgi:hypothetical protein
MLVELIVVENNRKLLPMSMEFDGDIDRVVTTNLPLSDRKLSDLKNATCVTSLRFIVVVVDDELH